MFETYNVTFPEENTGPPCRHKPALPACINDAKIERAISARTGATLLKITIDRTSGEPLHRQLYDVLRRAITGSRLAPGTRLPSTRSLAKSLGVSRNTVLSAYEILVLEGLLTGKVGSGTRVNDLRDGCCLIPAPRLQVRSLLRQAHYPVNSAGFEDTDGNLLYAHR